MRGEGGRGGEGRLAFSHPYKACACIQQLAMLSMLLLFLSLSSVHVSSSLESTRREREREGRHETLGPRIRDWPAGRPADPFDHETCLLVIIARRFASPRGRVPRLATNAGCIIADASMRLARRYRINRNSREPCLFRLYALYTLYTQTHADTNVFCRGSNFHVMRLVTRPTMHREILFLSSKVCGTEFRIQTCNTMSSFVFICRLYPSYRIELYYTKYIVYSLTRNRAND